MNTAFYKGVEFPLLPGISGIYATLPKFPNPYQNVRTGVCDVGSGIKLYHYTDLDGWHVATLQEQLIYVPRFQDQSKTVYCQSGTDNTIVNLNLLGREVVRVDMDGSFYLSENLPLKFSKPFDSDTLTANDPADLPNNFNCLITFK